MSNESGERRLSAIMFTDMVGYTSLTQSDEAHAIELLDLHNAKLRPLFLEFHGREIKAIGDSFLVEFDSALDACKCAAEIQKLLHDYNVASPDPWKIRLRVGIHLGDVVRRGGDVFGDTVNIASRIEPLADAEGICISGQVLDQIRNKLGLPIVELEQVELRNVKIPVSVYKILLPWEKALAVRRKTARLDRNRIAVLPFASMSSDPENVFFADGITEELISTISKISQLRVISRTSVMRYKDGNARLADIGKDLNVGSILEGSVRKAGNRVRTSVQLIEVETDQHLWSETYDRNLDDVFSIQTEIAQNVGSALSVQLLAKDRARIGQVQTENLEAHSLYLRGRSYALRVTLRAYQDAIRLFEEAIQRDPKYAKAYAGIADCYAGVAAWEIMPAKEVLHKARIYAQKALDMDDSIAEAHAALATVLNLQDWNFSAAETEFRRAIELNPSLAYAHMRLAFFLGQMGRANEAFSEIKLALELDPLSPETFSIAGVVYLYNGRIEEAKGLLGNAVELDANCTMALDNFGLCDVRTGQFQAGIQKIKKAIEIAGENHLIQLNDLAYAYARAGKLDETERILAELLKLWETGQGSACAIAGAYANLGEKDKAFDWLFRALEERSGYLFSIAIDFAFENLWQDPRWQIVLDKIGFNRVSNIPLSH